MSNPGCYALSAVSMLHPLVKAGLLPADYPVTINAVSGYSGGGRRLIAAFEDDEADDATDASYYLYGLDLEHKHVPEIQKHGSLSKRPLFVPSVGDFAQGMIVSLPLQSVVPAGLAHREAAARSDRGALRGQGRRAGHQRRAAVRHCVAQGTQAARGLSLDAEELYGTDKLTIHVFANEAREQAVICAVLDNLGKGASGQAVQNLELMLGLSHDA